MNKSELIEHLAAQHPLLKAESGRIVETLLDAIMTAVGRWSFPDSARSSTTRVPPVVA